MSDEAGLAAARAEHDTPTATVRVLVVDDDPDVAAVTARFLERKSDAAVSAVVEPTGPTALDRLESEEFDAVVSDYGMAGMDGLEFLRAVRKRDPEFPFILFTGKGSEGLASRAISAGVTDYVRKDGDTDRYDLLVRRVEAAVQRRRAERELSELNRINSTIRKTTQRVVRAATRPEIERAVCRALAESAPYAFAWLGRETEDDRVVPVARGGDERGYLDDVTIRTDRSRTGQGPTGRAARTGDPQAIQNLGDAPEFEPWRESAAERGYASSASVPLDFEDTRYGLLNVYAERPNAFDDRELDVLVELGTTVAHAIHRATLTERLERQYATLFEESPVMALTTRDTPDGPVVENCNRRFCQRLGYDRSAVVGQPIEAFYSTESARNLLDHGGYDRALTDEFTREQRTLVTADGESVEALLRAVPREDETGETVGTFALYVDISERKRLERENERLDEFASVVSHDLRNPLTVIKGRAELASEASESEDIDAILEAATRMEDLIEDLLALARQGEAVDETTSVRLSDVARDCWGNVETDGATLDVDEDLVVRADRSRLQQLLENLIANAIEHGTADTADAADLAIGVGPLTNGTGFYVADDGVGVPPDERGQVFEAGFSTDDNTGFGLSIVAEIAEAHGWGLELTDSEAGGARFEFRGVDVVSADR